MYRIEPLLPEDAVETARLARRSLETSLPPEVFLEAARQDPGLLWVARPEGSARVVGVILADASGPKEARIVLFAVSPEVQGQGVGRRLLRRLQAALQRRDVRRLVLEVRTDNPRAVDFYLRHGFTVLGLMEAVYPDGTDGLSMVKALP